jgi:predicted DNA-binding transcriptional regulator AlpA
VLAMDKQTQTDAPLVLRKSVVAQRLGTTIWTLDRWVKAGKFPPPLFMQDGTPAVWRLRDIEAFLDKRRRSRRVRPEPRGSLKQFAR